MSDPLTKSPESAVTTATELVLNGSVARVPIKLRGRIGSNGLQELSGSVSIDQSLASFLAQLPTAFADAVELVTQLVGSGSDISLERLAFGYSTGDQQKFAQIVVTIRVGTTSCDVIAIKGLNTPGGFIAGLDVRSDKTPFANNPLRGLIGDVAIGNMSVYYASEAFQSIKIFSGDAFQSADSLSPQALVRRGRDVPKGMSFSAEILIGGANLLDRLASAADDSQKSVAAVPPPAVTGSAQAQKPPLAASTKWINIDKTLGPLTFRRIGLGYGSPNITIKLDAALRLSVLTFTLEGLGLSFPLAKLTDPLNIWRYLRFQLDGASVMFQQGPLTISGGLLKVSDVPLQIDGFLLIRTQVLTITALASYADLDGTPSFFVFVALQKELGGPAFFFVTGLAFGFGINRALKLPSINEVQNFPLVKAATDPEYLAAGLDMRKISQALSEYIFPSKGNFWIAAGVKFNSFGMIDSFALLSVSFGTHFEVALLGLCRIQIPKQPPGVSAVPVIASAEMAIKVVFAPESGLLSCEARLTENSFVLRRDFKLRGGFAFYSWFAGEHEGDFVVSIGGYHPKFRVPAHYPRPDLVQFSCKIGDVTIEGHCYFALCPSAVMAGGGLSIVYQSGGIKAWFIAYADFLVQWKPVYYDIAIGVSIGVALNLTVAFIRISLSLELSAALALHGPPLGGTARISIWVVSFTVSFGDAKQLPAPLVWESNDLEKSFAKSFLPNPKVTTVTIAEGLIQEIRIDNRTIRLVNPQKLILNSRSVVPASEIRFNGSQPTDDTQQPLRVPTPKIRGVPADLAVRPLRKPTFYSLADITFQPLGGSDAAREYLKHYVEVAHITKSVPLALWGKPADLVAPPQDQMIDDALVGVEIRMKAGPRPWQTPVLDLEVLAYHRFRKSFEMTTTAPTEALSGFGEKTIESTIASTTVSARRNAILEALRRSGRKIIKPVEVQVSQLKDSAQYIFQDMPAMSRIGQYPPRDFRD